MNLVTILTDNWLDSHGARWVRYARKNTKAKLHLLYAGRNMGNKVLDRFDVVKAYPTSDAHRDWFNSVRMGACEIFDVNEIVYCDADADILKDIADYDSHLNISTELAYVQSPTMHEEYIRVYQEAFDEIPKTEANNGLLVLKRDWSKEYADAFQFAKKFKPKDRISGTIAFNIMLKQTTSHDPLPAEYSVVWTQFDILAKAKIVQYCNQFGQKKREELEALWRAVN